MSMEFEWDEARAEANLRKHGVSFEEAITVFGDALAITVFDAPHSAGEDRFLDIGRSVSDRVLIVVYTERGRRIRIIGCREATAAERRQYEQRQF